MFLKIKTDVFKRMLEKINKGVSNNKYIPASSRLTISIENNVLTLTSYDGSNYVKITYTGEMECEDATIVVEASKLIDTVLKTTKDEITLQFKENSLILKGNGNYTLKIYSDSTILPFKYEITDTDFIEFKCENSFLSKVLKVNKSALAQTMEDLALTCYYLCNTGAITADHLRITKYKTKTEFNGILIPSNLLDLIAIFDTPFINVKIFSGNILFYSDNIEVYGSLQYGAENFPEDNINQAIETSFENECLINRTDLLEALNRLSIYVTEKDKNGVSVQVSKYNMTITNLNTNTIEVLEIRSKNHTNDLTYEFMIDIDFWKNSISCQDCEDINLFYNGPGIKMIDDDVTYVVSLLEEEEENTEGDLN